MNQYEKIVASSVVDPVLKSRNAIGALRELIELGETVGVFTGDNEFDLYYQAELLRDGLQRFKEVPMPEEAKPFFKNLSKLSENY